MKKIILFVLVNLLAFNLGFAQWKESYNGIPGGIIGGNVRAFTIDPTTNEIYCGTDNGVYSSSDNGVSWKLLHQYFSFDSRIIVIELNGNNLYVGTDEGLFLITRSGDGWKRIDKGFKYPRVYSIHFKDNVMFVGTCYGIYSTSDNGENWKLLGLEDHFILTIEQVGNKMYAGTNWGLFTSTDNGINWSLETHFDSQIGIGRIIQNDNKLLFSTSDGIYYSLDNGANFKKITIDILPADSDGFSPIAFFQNNLIMLSGVDVYISKDLGSTWGKMEHVFPYFFEILFSKIINGKIYLCGFNGGFFISNDGGQKWNARNNGLTYILINRIRESSGILLAGTATGFYRSIDNGENWAYVGLDGIEPICFAYENNMIIGYFGDFGIFLSKDNGLSWEIANSGAIEESFVYSLEFCGNYIIAGTSSGIYRSLKNSINWQKIDVGITEVKTIKVKDNTIYAGTLSDGVYKSNNAGNSWESINGDLANSTGSFPSILAIEVHESGIFLGTQNKGVFRSVNNGANWQQTNNDFDDEFKAFTIFDNKVYVGGENGIIYQFDQLNGWVPVNSPLSQIEALQSSGNYLFAIEQDKALWRYSNSIVSKYLNVSPNTLSLNAAANSTSSFTITSNVSWTASSNQSWLTLSSSTGSNNGTITVTAATNTSNTSRTATVTVTGQGVTAQTVTVTQAGQSVTPTLTVSPSILNVNAAANSTSSFTITSNVSWTASSNQTWLTLSNSTGSNNGTITLTTAANTSNTSRTATVTVSGQGVTAQTVTVTQAGQSATPTLTVSPNSLNFGATVSSTSFSISSNVSWSVSVDQPWLSVSNSSGSNNGTITVNVIANSGVERTAKITVSANGLSSQYINVKQAAAGTPVLTVSRNAVVIGAAANSIARFNITANLDWVASSDQSWLTVSNASGNSNITMTLTAAENTSSQQRTASVTISGNGVASQIVSVTQNGASPTLNVSTSSVSLSSQASAGAFDITSNINWTASSDQGWLTLSKSSGSGNLSVNLTATANTSTTRTAIVTITGTGVTARKITVTQSGGVVSYLNVSTNAMTIGTQANSMKSFSVSSNISWTAVCNQSWLTLNCFSGSGDKLITMVASENNTTEKRNAIITISGIDVAQQSVTISQSGITTGIDDNGEDVISVYPNPVSDVLTVTVPSTLYDVTIELYSSSGTKLYSSNPSKEQELIDMSGYKSGLYILKIKTSEKVITKKIVKN